MKTLAFARFDVLFWLPRRQTLLPLVLIVVVGIVLPVPGMAVLTSAVVASMMISAPFLGDERGRLETLYGVLPLSRSDVVGGRALAIVVYYLVASVIAVVMTAVVGVVRGSIVPLELMGVALAVSFAFIGLAMSVQLPVLFRVGYSRGRLVAYAPALIVAGVLWLNEATGAFELGGLSFPVPVVLAAGIALGVMGVVVGALLASRAYGRRELR